MSILYEKRGRRYIPIADDRVWDHWPRGFALVYVPPNGGRATRFSINPERAGLLAAIKEREEALRIEISEAFKLRPVNSPLTPTQIKAWRAFEKAMGNNMHSICSESVYGVIDRIVKILEAE
jgi:hypothetical protein